MLAATGQSMAVARGMPGPAGEIILCTGQGIVSVAVDENGQPVEKPHICPDCALSLFAVAADEPDLPTRPLGSAEKLSPLRNSFAATAREVEPAARGPPVVALS
ncbi:hypothetical protein [Marimonas arenosa]|uniref:Uncharacterized protein n=1 Tax=Marimonas arenosa TaxID=1795305 RepID=A0AAE3WBN3_9RHOB|nr:hypothetical protein [Marimonas arenosa]MDQ2089981.1 hypothetical protein [Marimonas arenosa]